MGQHNARAAGILFFRARGIHRSPRGRAVNQLHPGCDTLLARYCVGRMRLSSSSSSGTLVPWRAIRAAAARKPINHPTKIWASRRRQSSSRSLCCPAHALSGWRPNSLDRSDRRGLAQQDGTKQQNSGVDGGAAAAEKHRPTRSRYAIARAPSSGSRHRSLQAV